MFTRPIRGWVIFAQVIGTIFAVVGLVAVAAEYDAILNQLGNNQENKVIIALILAILSYIIIKSVINAVVIIHACQTMDDITLSANRWIIASLSLTVGGFFTPFVMTMFPNVNIKSTIKPKVFLSKVYGWTLLVGGAAFIIIFGAVSNSALGYDDLTIRLTEGFMIVAGIFTLLGLVLVALFTRKNADQDYEANTALAGTMRVFANVIAGLVTLELIVLLIWNWMELISSIWEAFGSGNSDGSANPFMIVLAIFNLIIGLIYVGFLTQITCQTIGGIWRNEADYTIYGPLQNRQADTRTTTL